MNILLSLLRIDIVEDCKILIQAMKEVKQTTFSNSKDRKKALNLCKND